MTIRRFEALAHDALPRPIDTVVIVAGGFLVLGTELIGSSNGTAFDTAIVPGLIVATAIAARVGREAAQRRRGENTFGTSAIGLSRFVYLSCAAIAATMTVVFVMTPALTQLSELLGV